MEISEYIRCSICLRIRLKDIEYCAAECFSRFLVAWLCAVQEGVDAANRTLARPEQVKKFTIVEGDWLPSGDELTPTTKLKRKPIAEKYSTEIEELYSA